MNGEIDTMELNKVLILYRQILTNKDPSKAFEKMVIPNINLLGTTMEYWVRQAREVSERKGTQFIFFAPWATQTSYESREEFLKSHRKLYKL